MDDRKLHGGGSEIRSGAAQRTALAAVCRGIALKGGQAHGTELCPSWRSLRRCKISVKSAFRVFLFPRMQQGSGWVRGGAVTTCRNHMWPFDVA